MQKPTTVLGFTLLVISIIAAYLWHQLREQGAQNQQLSARLSALEATAQGSDSRVAQTSPALAAGEPPPPPASVAPVVAAALPPQQRGDASSMAALARQMMESPGGKEFQLVMQRQALARRYPDVQTALNLTPQQVQKLFDVLARRETENSEGRRLQPRGPIDRAAGEEMGRKQAEKDRAYRSELATVLGESYPKWDEYQIGATQRQHEGWERLAADDLRAAISSGNNSMSDAQFQAFNAAVTAEQERIDRTFRSPQQQLQSLPETSRRLMEVAAAHLSHDQLAAYRRHLEQETEMMRTVLPTLGEDE